jgi:hypothetical protein
MSVTASPAGVCLAARVLGGTVDWANAVEVTVESVWPKPRLDLTPRQRRVLAFVEDHIDQNGYPPAIREVAAASGLASASSAAYQLRQLVKLGYLTPAHKRGAVRATGVARRSA